MASIPCSSRQSLSTVRDYPDLCENQPGTSTTTSTTPSLQYFNMRVTERLHRYRSLKRQWYEVATNVQNESYLSMKPESPLLIPCITSFAQEQIFEPKICDGKDNLGSTTIIALKETNSRNSNDVNPLHSRIQQDLIKLRRLMNARQKKRMKNSSLKPNVTNHGIVEVSIPPVSDDQDNVYRTNAGRSTSLNRVNAFDRSKLSSGSTMRPSTFPQTSLIEATTNTLNNLSTNLTHNSKQQKFRQQNNNKAFNIYRTRMNACFNSDSFLNGVIPVKITPNTPPKVNSSSSVRSTQPYRLPMPSPLRKKQPSFVKQETPLPVIMQTPTIEPTTTCSYTYAAATSAATPRSMKLNRNRSLLPILLKSVSCVGPERTETQTQYDVDSVDDYYHLLCYQQLINRLPQPIITTRPEYNQDDYGILLEQLDHMRETMPDSHVYDNFTRFC